jgi:multisubunit Na+/H+ antiporter MnhB subunit
MVAAFRQLMLEPTDDFRGTLNVLIAIFIGLGVAWMAGHVSEEVRTGASALFGAAGSLLVVNEFRARLKTQLKYWLLVALVLAIAWLSYPAFSFLRSKFWQSFAAVVCGWLILLVFEFWQRRRAPAEEPAHEPSDEPAEEPAEEPSDEPEQASHRPNDALVSFGCVLIALGTVIAINPL